SKTSTPLRRMTICAILIVASSLAIQARFQDNPTGKVRVATAAREPQDDRQKGEGQPAPEVIGHWHALAARNMEPLAVAWSKRNGTPESIFGQILESFGEASEMAARRFLAENAPLFKMKGEPDELALARSHGSPLGQHFVFEQRYQGVPVYGAQTAIHFNRAG